MTDPTHQPDSTPDPAAEGQMVHKGAMPIWLTLTAILCLASGLYSVFSAFGSTGVDTGILQNDGLSGAVDAIENDFLYNTGSFLVSLLSIVAGYGVLRRRDWGRKAMIAFFVAVSIEYIYFGLVMLPPTIALMSQQMGSMDIGGNMGNLDDSMQTTIAIFGALILLVHGWIIFLLTRPKMKRLFG